MADDWADEQSFKIMNAIEQLGGNYDESARLIANALRAERNARQLFRKEQFPLHSGGIGTVKIECDALTPEAWEGLAELAKVTGALPAFGEVVGVPRGGLPFADALRPYATKGPRLVVDDVWTTGRSIKEGLREHNATTALVAFARDRINSPWCNAIFAPLINTVTR